MKLLQLNVLLVVIIFCWSTRAVPMVDDNEELCETMRSLQVLNFSPCYYISTAFLQRLLKINCKATEVITSR